MVESFYRVLPPIESCWIELHLELYQTSTTELLPTKTGIEYLTLILLRHSTPPLWSQHLFLHWTHPASHPRTKPGTLKISVSPKEHFLPQATINHLLKIKALQTTKIKKLNLLSLLALVFNRGFTISESKNNIILSWISYPFILED